MSLKQLQVPLLLYDTEEKYQQIELRVDPSAQLHTFVNPENEILLTTKSSPNHIYDIADNQSNSKYIQYKLNALTNEIVVTQHYGPHHSPNGSSCQCFKYRKELIKEHLIKRYNIILFPIFIFFIIFGAVIGASIYHKTNTTTVSYFSNPITAQFRINASQSEIEAIKMCGIYYQDIHGWFDGNSFNARDMKWHDYSSYKNHINASYILNKIKLGLINNYSNRLYVYGGKYDSINMPSQLKLNKQNYTIVTVARYNGNDNNTIFISHDSEWVFGFENNKYDVVYHEGIKITDSLSASMYDRGWVVNVDSTTFVRSQQQTLYNNTNTNYNGSINWGINIQNGSAWAVSAMMIFDEQLTKSQIECVETFLIDKYNLLSNESVDANQSNHTDVYKISECDRWSAVNYDHIVSWYDVNNGFDGNTLFDLSGHSNHISIAKNIKVGVHKYNFRYLYGSRNDIINIPNSISFNNDYLTAIYYIGRYNGNDKGSVMADGSNKFYFGFYQQNSGVCYLDGIKLSEFETNIYGDEWLLSSIYVDDTYHTWYCTQNCDTFFIDGSGLFETVQLNLSVNGEYDSDWALTEIIILKMKKKRLRFIPFRDSICIEQYLSNKYNINSYQYNIENV
eukprot:517987_1